MIVDFDGISYELNEEDVKELLELADELARLVNHRMPYANTSLRQEIITAADIYRSERQKRARKAGDTYICTLCGYRGKTKSGQSVIRCGKCGEAIVLFKMQDQKE